MPKLIDANVILRYLLDDVPDMSVKAGEIIAGGAFTTPEVIAEVVYVLKGVYNIDKPSIASGITAVLTEVEIEHVDVYRRALEIFSCKNLDFVDCILIARHQIMGEEIFSFDKKLNNNLDN